MENVFRAVYISSLLRWKFKQYYLFPKAPERLIGTLNILKHFSIYGMVQRSVACCIQAIVQGLRTVLQKKLSEKRRLKGTVRI